MTPLLRGMGTEELLLVMSAVTSKDWEESHTMATVSEEVSCFVHFPAISLAWHW